MALPTFWLVLYAYQVFLYSSMLGCLVHAVPSKFVMHLNVWLPSFESLSLQSEGFAISDSSRVKRLHSNRAGELTAPCF